MAITFAVRRSQSNLEKIPAPSTSFLVGAWDRRGERGSSGGKKNGKDSLAAATKAALQLSEEADSVTESDGLEAEDVSSDEDEEWTVTFISLHPSPPIPFTVPNSSFCNDNMSC